MPTLKEIQIAPYSLFQIEEYRKDGGIKCTFEYFLSLS